MGRRTHAPLGHEHSARLSARMARLPPGAIVGEKGRDHPLQAQARARMEPPQQSRHGQAAPRPLLRRLAERLLERRGIGHGAARALDQEGAMALPAPFL
jgi:hypothetical protein